MIPRQIKGEESVVSPGLKIATNTVANTTSFFSFTTKIFVQLPLGRLQFCMIFKYYKALKLK